MQDMNDHTDSVLDDSENFRNAGSPHSFRAWRDDRTMKCLAIVVAVSIVAILPAYANANDVSFQDRRSDLAGQIAMILGPETVKRTQPFVADAEQRVIDAIQTVDAANETPMQILDLRQKIALRRARRTHEMPSLELRSDQRRALDRYFGAMISAVEPIVRDDGHAIEVQLSPDQRHRIDQLRVTVDRVPRPAIAAELTGPLVDVGLASAGRFVLLVSVDPKALVEALR
jgi:predicted secreted protein